jgi:WW domain
VETKPAMGPQRVEDATVPPPWQALFDPASNLKYYWNPNTNVTQYEHPAGGAPPPSLQPPSSGYNQPSTASYQVFYSVFCSDSGTTCRRALAGCRASLAQVGAKVVWRAEGSWLNLPFLAFFCIICA